MEEEKLKLDLEFFEKEKALSNLKDIAERGSPFNPLDLSLWQEIR